MEKRFFDFEVKADGEGRRISGYGSVFGSRDLGGDVVMPGAFAKSIASGRKIRMLFQHDSSKVIGKWTKAYEDENGLHLEGELADTPRGNEIHTLLKMDAISGLSIGYRTIKDEWRDNSRLLHELDLREVSVVTFPMNELSNVDAVKAATMEKKDFEEKLTRDAGLSRGVARALLNGGFDAVKSMPGAGNDSEREMIEMLKSWSNK